MLTTKLVNPQGIAALMFFILSKILIYLFKPFFWILGALVLSFILKNARWKKGLRIGALVVLLVCTNSVLTHHALSIWEDEGIRTEELSNYHCGIVLGGFSDYNEKLDRLYMECHGDRIFQAIDLYKRGKIRKILISGDDGRVDKTELDEAAQTKKILIRWGIPDTDILSEEISANTHENAVESTRMLKISYPHFKRNILITSAIHMKRAKACFEKLGMKVIPFSTNHYASTKNEFHWSEYFVPDSENFELWDLLIKEFVGYVVYDLSGYI